MISNALPSNSAPSPTPSPPGASRPNKGPADSQEKPTQETVQQAVNYLVSCGCTDDEARQAVALLLGMGVPPEHLDAWLHDVMALVRTALDAILAP